MEVAGSIVVFSARKTVEMDSPRGSVGDNGWLSKHSILSAKEEVYWAVVSGGGHSEVSILRAVTHKSPSEYTHTYCHTSITITCVIVSTVVKIFVISPAKRQSKHFEQQTSSCAFYTENCTLFEDLFISVYNYKALKLTTPVSRPPQKFARPRCCYN